MTEPSDLNAEIAKYLARVSACAAHLPGDEKADLLENIENHIREALSRRSPGNPTVDELRAVLAEMDPPESYSAVGASVGPAQLPSKGPSKDTQRTPAASQPSRPIRFRAIAEVVILHSIPLVGLFAFLKFGFSEMAYVIDDMGVQLPAPMRVVLAATDFIAYYWPLLGIAGGVLLAVDGYICVSLDRRVGKGARLAWSLAVLLLELCLILAIAGAVVLPFRAMMNSMN